MGPHHRVARSHSSSSVIKHRPYPHALLERPSAVYRSVTVFSTPKFRIVTSRSSDWFFRGYGGPQKKVGAPQGVQNYMNFRKIMKSERSEHIFSLGTLRLVSEVQPFSPDVRPRTGRIERSGLRSEPPQKIGLRKTTDLLMVKISWQW